MSYQGTCEVSIRPGGRAGRQREGGIRNPMSRMEKSDSAIRAGKPANKEGQPTAERAEQRAGTKENPGGRNACRTQSREKRGTGDRTDTASGKEKPAGNASRRCCIT